MGEIPSGPRDEPTDVPRSGAGATVPASDGTTPAALPQTPDPLADPAPAGATSAEAAQPAGGLLAGEEPPVDGPAPDDAAEPTAAEDVPGPDEAVEVPAADVPGDGGAAPADDEVTEDGGVTEAAVPADAPVDAVTTDADPGPVDRADTQGRPADEVTADHAPIEAAPDAPDLDAPESIAALEQTAQSAAEVRVEDAEAAARRAAAAAQAAADLAVVKEWAARRAAEQAAEEAAAAGRPVPDETDAARVAAEQAAADLAAVREWAAQRAADEQAAADRAAAEQQAATDQAAAERAAVERIEAARLATAREAEERAAAAQQAEVDRLAAERAVAEQAESRRAAALAAERAATERAATEQAAAEQAAARATEQQAARQAAAAGPPAPRAASRSARTGGAPDPAPGATVAPSRGRRRAAGRRRPTRALVAALVALVLVAAGVVLAIDLTGGRGDDPAAPQAEQVPDAVLPELAGPQPVLTELAASAPVPDPTVLTATLDPLLAAPALGSGLSAQVVDVATGQVLLDRDGADPGTPASTNKLLTSVAALTTLDPTATVPTTVVAGSAPGEVVLVGGGDPTLSTVAPSTDYPGAATVADLAEQVSAALGGTPVTRVVVDGSLFSGPETAPGWGPGDAPSTYAAPVTAAAVDGARARPGRDPRSGQPATDAGAALAAALGAPGVPVELGTAPAGARTLGEVRSAPVARLVEQALTASDNLLAETLARQVALARDLPASFDGGAQAVTAALAEAGLDTTGVSLHDGSGLSGDDRVPARLLVDVLRGAADGSVPGVGALLSGLPVAGYDGTLAERAADGSGGPAAVRAKTGTLGGVNDLAGTVLTAEGRLLAFAVLADGTTGGLQASETALDRVAAALAGCGCR